MERARASTFGDVALEGTSPLDHANALASYLSVRAHGRVAFFIHTGLGVATFFFAHGRIEKNLAPVAAFVLLFAARATLEHHAAERRMDAARHAFDAGVSLPTADVSHGWALSEERFVVKRDGALSEVVPPSMVIEARDLEDVEREVGGRTSRAVFADADLRCGALAAALLPKERYHQSFALAAMPSTSQLQRPFVGDLEPLVGDRTLVGLGFDFGQHYPVVEATLADDTLTLKLPGEPALAFPLAGDPQAVLRAVTAKRPAPLTKRETVQLTVRASESTQHLATALAVLTTAFPMPERWQRRYFALRVDY
jgi:hypothetical protein